MAEPVKSRTISAVLMQCRIVVGSENSNRICGTFGARLAYEQLSDPSAFNPPTDLDPYDIARQEIKFYCRVTLGREPVTLAFSLLHRLRCAASNEEPLELTSSETRSEYTICDWIGGCEFFSTCWYRAQQEVRQPLKDSSVAAWQ